MLAYGRFLRQDVFQSFPTLTRGGAPGVRILEHAGRGRSRSRENPDALPVNRAPSVGSGIAQRSLGNPCGFPPRSGAPLLDVRLWAIPSPAFHRVFGRAQRFLRALKRDSLRSSGRGAGISSCRSIRPRPAASVISCRSLSSWPANRSPIRHISEKTREGEVRRANIAEGDPPGARGEPRTGS